MSWRSLSCSRVPDHVLRPNIVEIPSPFRVSLHPQTASPSSPHPRRFVVSKTCPLVHHLRLPDLLVAFSLLVQLRIPYTTAFALFYFSSFSLPSPFSFLSHVRSPFYQLFEHVQIIVRNPIDHRFASWVVDLLDPSVWRHRQISSNPKATRSAKIC